MNCTATATSGLIGPIANLPPDEVIFWDLSGHGKNPSETGNCRRLQDYGLAPWAQRYWKGSACEPAPFLAALEKRSLREDQLTRHSGHSCRESHIRLDVRL